MTIKQSPFQTTKVILRRVWAKSRWFRTYGPSEMGVEAWWRHYTGSDGDGLMLDILCAKFEATQRSSKRKIAYGVEVYPCTFCFLQGSSKYWKYNCKFRQRHRDKEEILNFLERCVVIRRERAWAVSICIPRRLMCFKDQVAGTRLSVLPIIKAKLSPIKRHWIYTRLKLNLMKIDSKIVSLLEIRSITSVKQSMM